MVLLLILVAATAGNDAVNLYIDSYAFAFESIEGGQCDDRPCPRETHMK